MRGELTRATRSASDEPKSFFPSLLRGTDAAPSWLAASFWGAPNRDEAAIAAINTAPNAFAFAHLIGVRPPRCYDNRFELVRRREVYWQALARARNTVESVGAK